MNIEPVSAIEEVLPLLAECALPVADVSASVPLRFFGVRNDGALVAVVGLEIYPPFGLLRSLAVAPTFRGCGLARKLVAFAESFSAAQGIESLFLLTTTAEGFFLRLGYLPTPRSSAPPAIQATSQFSGLCPSSSAFLSKGVAGMRASPEATGVAQGREH